VAHYQKLAKLAVATVGTALSFAAVMKANPASAADFSFNQLDYNQGGVLSGTFSGTPDANGSIISPTTFSATYQSNDSTFNSSYSLGNLLSFQYNQSASPVLSLLANNGTFRLRLPDPNSNDGISGGFVRNIAQNTSQTTGSNATVVAGVPEPTNVMGVMLVGLGGLGGLLKKKSASSQKVCL